MATKFCKHIRDLKPKQNMILWQYTIQFDVDLCIVNKMKKGEMHLKKAPIPLLAQKLKVDIKPWYNHRLAEQLNNLVQGKVSIIKKYGKRNK